MNLDIGDTRLIIDECRRFGCLRNQAAYILATAYWETARKVKPVVEAFWLSESWRRKNLRYYPWHGRGYVQLTWEDNYKRAQKKTGYPVHDDPEKALAPEPSAAILVRGSMEGWFTGKKISDYITLQKSDFHNARRVINGRDKASEIAAIAVDYDEALKAEGYGLDVSEKGNIAEVNAAIPVPKAKPKVHKSLMESKELIGGATGLLAAVSAFFEKMDGNTIALVLGALALGFIANRLHARWKDER